MPAPKTGRRESSLVSNSFYFKYDVESFLTHEDAVGSGIQSQKLHMASKTHTIQSFLLFFIDFLGGWKELRRTLLETSNPSYLTVFSLVGVRARRACLREQLL